MNVLFVSPAFPPQFYLFCTALRAEGVRVLGLGDTPPAELRPELRAALAEYVYVARLDDHEQALRAVAYLTWRHGRIDRIDSLNEHWLALEAQLRADFNVPGLRPAEVARYRSKAAMAEVYTAAGIEHPPCELVRAAAQVRAFAARVGYPLIFKPDVGVGAERTFKVSTPDELEATLAEPLAGYLVQRFVEGTVTSFDGLVDRDGRVVFCASLVYGGGVMELRAGEMDVFYHTRREIPPALEAAGRRAVAAFGLRERFFHAEFFERPDGTFAALEMNLRPPGGFTTDMMNYAADADVYRLWAQVIAGRDVTDFRYERRYYCAHAARRRGRRYRVPDAELPARLGPALLVRRELPSVFAAAMGDVAYLLRHAEHDGLEAARRLVQDRGD